jgi:hypothetical protein
MGMVSVRVGKSGCAEVRQEVVCMCMYVCICICMYLLYMCVVIEFNRYFSIYIVGLIGILVYRWYGYGYGLCACWQVRLR